MAASQEETIPLFEPDSSDIDVKIISIPKKTCGRYGFWTSIFFLFQHLLDISTMIAYFPVYNHIFFYLSAGYFISFHLLLWILFIAHSDTMKKSFSARNEWSVPNFFFYCPILVYIYQRCSTIHDPSYKIISSIEVAFVDFPLYVIKVAFILYVSNTFGDIQWYIWMSLSWSIFSLTILNIDRMREITQNINNNNILQPNFQLYLFQFFIILLDVINFIPIFVAYTMDHDFAVDQLTDCLYLFNLPKLILMIAGLIVSDIILNNNDSTIIMRIVTIIGYIVSYSLFPSVAFMVQWFTKLQQINTTNTSNKLIFWRYICYIIYLFISYVGVNIYIIVIVGGLTEMSLYLSLLWIVVWILVLLITILIPFVMIPTNWNGRITTV